MAGLHHFTLRTVAAATAGNRCSLADFTGDPFSKQLGEATDKAVKMLLMNVLIPKIDRKPEFRDIFTAEELLHELLAYYEEQHEHIQQTLLLMDASHLADIQGYRIEAYR